MYDQETKPTKIVIGMVKNKSFLGRIRQPGKKLIVLLKGLIGILTPFRDIQ